MAIAMGREGGKHIKNEKKKNYPLFMSENASQNEMHFFFVEFSRWAVECPS